jgi:protein-S-isoprenylcysteine O-methyltransferase Ste14
MKPWYSNNLLPAMIWTGFYAFVPTWHWDFFTALMLLRAAVILAFFLIREEPTRRAPGYQIAVAWVSTFVPTLMVWNPAGQLSAMIGELLSIGGMLFFIFTCLDLGKSFGVSPAVRPYVDRGVYSRIPHPMYLSHAVLEAGVLIASPTPTNFAVVGVAWALYALRAIWEADLWNRARLN